MAKNKTIKQDSKIHIEPDTSRDIPFEIARALSGIVCDIGYFNRNTPLLSTHCILNASFDISCDVPTLEQAILRLKKLGYDLTVSRRKNVHTIRIKSIECYPKARTVAG